MNKSPNQNVFSTFPSVIPWAYSQTKKTDFLIPYTLLTSEIPTLSNTSKNYPFRAESPRIDLYRDYPRELFPQRSDVSAECSDYGSLTVLFTEI